ncbi:MAG TPA: hypothetical protein VMS56_05980 [Thermoanaerobaculia bacterium]|nr:hypothetical protein [Thermoanaerobaculia bacterium]
MRRYSVERIFLTDSEGKPAVCRAGDGEVIVNASDPEDAIHLFVREQGATLVTEPSSFRSFSAVAVARIESRYLCLEATVCDGSSTD